jgi:hypothetical protein
MAWLNYTSRLKPKDMIPTPWMVAMALQHDGWYLRSDVIWSKPSPMPESVTDRPTKSHEYVFLLSKGPRYFYDADAIREPADPASFNSERPETTGAAIKALYGYDGIARTTPQGRTCGVHESGGRNKRSVWTVATQPYPGAHFATFPPKLIEPCILAGCPERACSECGAPWERIVERTTSTPGRNPATSFYVNNAGRGDGDRGGAWTDMESCTLGFAPSCTHDATTPTTPTTPGVVLDPFAGSGTTGLVALRHGRSFIGIESNPEYVELARWRIVDDAPLLNSVAEVAVSGYAHGMSETQTPDPQREQQQPDQPEQQPEADPTAPEPDEQQQQQPERDPAEGEPRRGVPAEP